MMAEHFIDRARLQELLTDSVTALCKDALNQEDCRISIDGLIGITVNENNVFLVKIDEKINNEDYHISRENSPSLSKEKTSHMNHETLLGATDISIPPVPRLQGPFGTRHVQNVSQLLGSKGGDQLLDLSVSHPSPPPLVIEPEAPLVIDHMDRSSSENGSPKYQASAEEGKRQVSRRKTVAPRKVGQQNGTEILKVPSFVAKNNRQVVNERFSPYGTPHRSPHSQSKNNSVSKHEKLIQQLNQISEKPLKSASTKANNKAMKQAAQDGVLSSPQLTTQTPGRAMSLNKDEIRNRLTKSDSTKQLQCHLCGKTFTSVKGRRRHLDIHRGKSYRCNLCGATCSRKDAIMRHRKRKHGIDTPLIDGGDNSFTEISRHEIPSESETLLKTEQSFQQPDSDDSDNTFDKTESGWNRELSMPVFPMSEIDCKIEQGDKESLVIDHSSNLEAEMSTCKTPEFEENDIKDTPVFPNFEAIISK